MSQGNSLITDLASIPTISDLYRASELQPSPPDAPTPSPSSILNVKISLVRASITTLAVTSIVNAANQTLLGGGGVDGAIHAAAGPSLLAECRALNGCPTGSAKITSAHELPSKYIIHAVGPVYHRAKRERDDLPAELLRGCYRTSLQLAAEKGGSIAFSCISTGVYGYPSGEAAEVATREVRQFLLEEQERGGEGRLERVVFCCFEQKDVRAYEKWLPKIFPPTPSELPDSSSTPSELAPSSEIYPASPNPHISTHATETTSADDAASEDWETIEKPDHTSPGAQGLESNKESLKTDSVDADVSGTLVARVNDIGGKKDLADDKKGEEKMSDAGSKAEIKHGLLKDW
ncbi:hypothetical protein MMC22_002746 [Lobaria immixta]|nr:hypothetical protein [Lobaria immixta]